MFFRRKQLRNTSKLINYNISNLVLIVYCSNIKILINVALQLLYRLNLSLALNLLISQLLKLLQLNLLLN